VFFIASMPRTRTYWLAKYFSGLPGVVCHHDLLGQITSRQEFYDEMERPGTVGNSDCGLYMTDFQDRWPDAPTLIVERPLPDVRASLDAMTARHGLPAVPDAHLQDMQDRIDRLWGMRIEFDDLDNSLQDVHEYFGFKFYPEYAAQMCQQNEQLQEVSVNTDAFALWKH
jgi:hypothetical protein